MAIGLQGRLETFARLRESELESISELRQLQQEAIDEAFALQIGDSSRRRDIQLASELENLVYNMSQRTKARGVKEKSEKYLWLHKLRFEQTFIDLHSAEQKDVRVRAYFDSLLAACDGDKKLLLAAYKKELDRFYPIARDDIYWMPALRKVHFTPTRRGDTRTSTYTIVHLWGHTMKTT